jgi:hypothetical protein
MGAGEAEVLASNPGPLYARTHPFVILLACADGERWAIFLFMAYYAMRGSC